MSDLVGVFPEVGDGGAYSFELVFFADTISLAARLAKASVIYVL